MKKQLLSILIVLLIPISLIAQDGYSFTLTDNGGYSFSITAVPNYDSGTYTPKTESYGFTLVVPDGVTITVTDVQPSGSVESISPIPGTNVSSFDPTMADKDLFLITVVTNAGNLPSHINDAQLPLLTFTVDGTPTVGDLTLLDNGSTLASDPALSGSLDSYLQVDVTDDATVNFINGYLGQTGETSFSFSTLGMLELEELGIELFPNPTPDAIFIEGLGEKTNVKIYNTIGAMVLERKDYLNGKISLGNISPGVYFVKMINETGGCVKEIIKE